MIKTYNFPQQVSLVIIFSYNLSITCIWCVADIVQNCFSQFLRLSKFLITIRKHVFWSVDDIVQIMHPFTISSWEYVVVISGYVFWFKWVVYHACNTFVSG